jgi:hypothetical protein
VLSYQSTELEAYFQG